MSKVKSVVVPIVTHTNTWRQKEVIQGEIIDVIHDDYMGSEQLFINDLQNQF